MKRLTTFLFTLLAITACKKENKTGPAASGSIIWQQSLSANSGSYTGLAPFTSQDSITVYGLMNSNNLPTNGFIFYRYESYNGPDPNNQLGFYQLATAEQVRNGLPVFSEDVTFSFENGKLAGGGPAPQLIAGNIALDDKPTLSLQNLRNAFIKEDNAEGVGSPSIQDSTLVAQLGYYNVNIGQLSTGGTPNYIKVWFVRPQHSAVPQGFFRDDNAAVISFTPVILGGPAIP